MRAPPFQLLEFFAGGGMARLGLADHFEAVFANDMDPAKCQSYRKNFGPGDLVSHLIETDIAALDPARIPTADLAWASFPCQDLSLAGARGGLGAERSSVFWTFWQLMEAMAARGTRPPLIAIENVTGLLSSHGGADFRALVDALVDADYWVGGMVLDAASFSPQSRPRLFLVTSRMGPTAELVSATPDPAIHTTPVQRAAAGLVPASRARWVWWALPALPLRNAQLADLLARDVPQNTWQSEDKLAHCLSLMTPQHRARVELAVADRSFRAGAVYRRIRAGQQRAEVRYDGLAGCLRTLKGGSSRQLLLISENGQLGLRPLLPREAARLMGLPEQYQLPETMTAAMNLIGDGVSVPVVKWLADQLLAPLANLNRQNLPSCSAHGFETRLRSG